MKKNEEDRLSETIFLMFNELSSKVKQKIPASFGVYLVKTNLNKVASL